MKIREGGLHNDFVLWFLKESIWKNNLEIFDAIFCHKECKKK